MSLSAGDILAALAYAGVGAGVGSIGAAAITSRSGKGEARAHAADLIANAAGELADRVTKLNERLETQNLTLHDALSKADAANLRQREAILALTSVINNLISDLPLAPAKLKELRRAVEAAKRFL